jgi:DNA-binding SARP family transcriptional activator/tetratricopeptide (TPR) repeat protein
MLTLKLFGGFALHAADRPLSLPSQPSRLLLAYCAIHPARRFTRSHLAGLLWPDLPEAHARRRLSHTLWEAQQALPRIAGRSYLARAGALLYFDATLPHEVDVVTFEACLRRAQTAAPAQPGYADLTQAAALYTGTFLAGFYDDWVVIEQERLREGYLDVLQHLIALAKAQGAFGWALQHALSLIASDPLRETAYQEAIRLAVHLGEPHTAHRVYAQLAATLQAELQLAPSATTQRLLAAAEPAPPQEALPLAAPNQDLPLVGRTHERQALLAAVDRAQRGMGGMILLCGEAGLGKSRLLRTLTDDAEWRAMPALWGRSSERAAGKPFAPLLAALGAGLTPLRAQHLAGLVDTLWLAALTPLLPQLGAWLPDLPAPPPLTAAAERIRLLEAFTRLLLGMGVLTPLLVILEDLHWADPATFDALTYLLQRLPASRVLLIGSARLSDAREEPLVWAGLEALDRSGQMQRITLDQLNYDQTRRLVQFSLQTAEANPHFVQRIYGATAGNPLFVLESLRTLYAEGMLTRTEHHGWRTPFDAPADPAAALPLAPALADMITRRLQRLLPAEQRVLAAAAVLGAQFDLPLLSRLVVLEGRDLLAALGGLLRRQVLNELPTGYSFAHDLIHATVYRNLPTAQRAELHRRAAALLAETRPSDAALIARQFAAGALWSPAAMYALQASRQALATHSYRSALEYLDHAEQFAGRCAEPPFALFDLLALRCDVLDELGDRRRQAADLQALERSAAADPVRRLHLQRLRGRYWTALGDHQAAVGAFEGGLQLAHALDDQAAVVALLGLLGKTLNWSGQQSRALEILDATIRQARAVGDRRAEAEAHQHLCGIHHDRSEHEPALAAAERAIELYEALGHQLGAAEVQATLGAVAMEQGRLDDAEAYYAQALPIIQASGQRYAEARLLVNWGSIDYLRGQIGRAIARFRQGATIFGEIGSARGMHFTYLNLAATVSNYVGSDEELEARTIAARDFFAAQAETSAGAQAYGVLAQFAALRGDVAQSAALYQTCLDSLSDAPDPWVEAQTYQALALAWLAAGQWAAALKAASAALQVSAAYGFHDLTAFQAALQSRALLGMGDIVAARTMLEANAPAGAYGAHFMHFTRFAVLQAGGDIAAAQVALAQAEAALNDILTTLDPADQMRSRREIPLHRDILVAYAAIQPLQRTVELPRRSDATGPGSADPVAVTWTIETAEDRLIAQRSRRRRVQLARLIAEASAQGAQPSNADLAAALNVSERTIRRDRTLMAEG